jgi:hypothetical protein
LIEIARLRGKKEMSLIRLGKKHIVAFCKALKKEFRIRHQTSERNI